MERDLEERADIVLGALKGVTSLMAMQTKGLSVPSEELVYLMEMITGEAEKVLPIDRRKFPGFPGNDR